MGTFRERALPLERLGSTYRSGALGTGSRARTWQHRRSSAKRKRIGESSVEADIFQVDAATDP